MTQVSMRPFRKLLRAVSDLHVRGYQRLRIVPQFGGAGFWRCHIAPAIYIARAHGARLAGGVTLDDIAVFSSGSGDQPVVSYWGWRDEHHCTPGQLAAVFLERFPQLAELGYGQDWLYAGWYQHMLHLTHPDLLPVAEGEYLETDNGLLTLPERIQIPLPPPGYAVV